MIMVRGICMFVLVIYACNAYAFFIASCCVRTYIIQVCSISCTSYGVWLPVCERICSRGFCYYCYNIQIGCISVTRKYLLWLFRSTCAKTLEIGQTPRNGCIWSGVLMSRYRKWTRTGCETNWNWNYKYSYTKGWFFVLAPILNYFVIYLYTI